MMNQKTRAVRALYQTYFRSFAKFAYGLLHPNTPLLPAWYLDVIGHHLELCFQKKIKRLIIEMPPRYLKSYYASVAFPSWILGRAPDSKIFSIAGNSGLMNDQIELVTRIMMHRQYRALFPHISVEESNQSIRTKHGGGRFGFTVTKNLTGRGADYIIIDDPISPSKAEDSKALARINEWFDRNIYQRLNDKNDGVIIVVMQRLHNNDLVGHLTKNEEWTVLSLPAIATVDEKYVPLYGEEVQRKKGEALNPKLESVERLRTAMLDMGANAFMAQYQQGPYADSKGEGRSGAYSSLRQGEPWQVGQPYPDKCLEHMPEETILMHTVFGEGEHPWPDNMRIGFCGAESMLAHSPDEQRWELIQVMTPRQRATFGINPCGTIFPDFTQYLALIHENDHRYAKKHNPNYRPQDINREFFGNGEYLPQDFFDYG